MAEAGADVTLMDISRGFLSAARARAKAHGVALTLVNDSANRLLFREEEYDVVTVCQALHWLDDVAVCRGIYRVLRDGGSFFVIDVRAEVKGDHPLADALGEEAPFRETARALSRRLTLLFRALDTTDVGRLDFARRSDAPATSRIEIAGTRIFRKRRSLPMGYARAFFTSQHVAEQVEDMGKDEASFWSDLEARYENATASQIVGTEHWAVHHFRRAGGR